MDNYSINHVVKLCVNSRDNWVRNGVRKSENKY